MTKSTAIEVILNTLIMFAIFFPIGKYYGDSLQTSDILLMGLIIVVAIQWALCYNLRRRLETKEESLRLNRDSQDDLFNRLDRMESLYLSRKKKLAKERKRNIQSEDALKARIHQLESEKIYNLDRKDEEK